MPACTFVEARRMVLEKLSTVRRPVVEHIPLSEADGRVLACNVHADRDYPPTSRSIRDGFAVRAEDLPGSLDVIGEAPAGGSFDGIVGPGQCVEIMTGAPVPNGANAIVMVEHTRMDGNRMVTEKSPQTGEFINPKASEARHGATLMTIGRRLSFPDVGMLATVGKSLIEVFEKPTVAILSTGDEVVPVESTPAPNQVRNSNAWTIAALVKRCGGIPVILPLARDNWESLLPLVEQGLTYDMLLLSGGVSAGKYDLVEKALAHCGAEFYFDRVLIQPGQPAVFGKARDKFFFGLPGNPGSTMVTFSVFARAAIELLGGANESPLPMPYAKLTAAYTHKPGLTRFAPAQLSLDGTEITPVTTQGSSDVPALARSNAYLVADADRETWEAGEWMRVLLR